MKRLKAKLDEVRGFHAEADRKAAAGSFAYGLAAESFGDHAAELGQLATVESDRPVFELVDFRLTGLSFRSGSIPLGLLTRASDEIRKMFGFAALRLSAGGLKRVRVPREVYDALGLRLAGLLPGSTRLLIAAEAHRDLFDGGLAKDALDRLFRVLGSEGKGESFLEAVTDLGPSSARSLREFLQLLSEYSAEIDLTWRYAGSTVRQWKGTERAISDVRSALAVTEIREQAQVVLEGFIDLLSSRERLEILTSEGARVRVLYPKKLLGEVSKLHLKQSVKLLCQSTETENPLTSERSLYYELLAVQE